MKLIEPTYRKAELLDRAAISSAQFNNWRWRLLLPLNDLGVERESLRTHKYSPLVAAYLICLKYHTGQDRKLYVETLKTLFRQIAKQDEFNEGLTVAITGFGKGKDCGVFESHATAMQLSGRQCAYVPVGQIIKQQSMRDE